MPNQYIALKTKQQQEIDDFPMFFAFSKKQVEKGMLKLGLTVNDRDKICPIGGTGGFLRCRDESAFYKMLNRHRVETQAATDSDLTGRGFIFEMFNEELANHEYAFTQDVSDTLEYLGLTEKDVANDAKLARGLSLAIARQCKA
jgi:hypothetical protein